VTPKAQEIRNLVKEAGSHLCSVTFIKADGSERSLTWNPKHAGEIKGTGKTNADPEKFVVMDIKLNQWRSFKADRVTKIKVNGKVRTFD